MKTLDCYVVVDFETERPIAGPFETQEALNEWQRAQPWVERCKQRVKLGKYVEP